MIPLQGASTPNIPKELSPQAEELVNFKVPVVHSSQFRSREEEVLDISRSSEDDATVVVVGGGKSAQE
jgi:lysine/ornithine N-monooxygenase